jgi:hypothetical protein
MPLIDEAPPSLGRRRLSSALEKPSIGSFVRQLARQRQ